LLTNRSHRGRRARQSPAHRFRLVTQLGAQRTDAPYHASIPINIGKFSAFFFRYQFHKSWLETGFLFNPIDSKTKRAQALVGVKTKAIEGIVVLFLMGAGVCIWVTPHTWHTPGFSNQNFSKIKVGTPENEVHSLIGDPNYGGGDGYWLYTRPGHSFLPSTYWQERGLVVSNGFVVRIIKTTSYYED
jgi:hypothetical protein